MDNWQDREPYSRFLGLFQRKLLGGLVQRGLRAKAQSRLLAVLQLLKRRQGVAPSTILLGTFLRLAPEVQLKGGSKRPYAAPVPEAKKITLAVRWLLRAIPQNRRNVSLRRLAEAIEEVLKNRGPAVVTKRKIYRQAVAVKHQKLRFKV